MADVALHEPELIVQLREQLRAEADGGSVDETDLILEEIEERLNPLGEDGWSVFRSLTDAISAEDQGGSVDDTEVAMARAAALLSPSAKPTQHPLIAQLNQALRDEQWTESADEAHAIIAQINQELQREPAIVVLDRGSWEVVSGQATVLDLEASSEYSETAQVTLAEAEAAGAPDHIIERLRELSED